VVCPGANHAPQEHIDKYKGRFDDGYEAYREWVLPRMIERGILPEGTELTPINPMTPGTFDPGDAVRPWDSLSDDEKRLFSRMAEVYAGFSEYTDAQVGRIVDYLEESGQLDNTLVIYAADNGASGEGSPNGSVNENKFFNAWPDTVEDNLALIDQLGTPATYNHYPTGWAVAFSTPFRMFKRYSYQGGVCDPLVIHWPAGITARGEVRGQCHHCTDIVPTILDVCGVEMPEVVDGHRQTPLPGCRCATASTTPTPRRPSRPSTTRCWAPAASGTRAGRRSPSTARSRSGSAGSTRTAGSCSTPTRTGPRPTTSPTSIPTRWRS
jgi:arylsulfatase A-like enzyme